MLAIVSIGFIRKQRYIGFFALLSGLALLTAIGTPINYLFYYLIPGFSSFGGPNRILLLYLFGIGALAGFAAQYIAEHGADKVRSWRGKQVGAAEMPMCWASIILLTLYMVSRGIAVSSFGMSAELSSAALDRVDMTFMALLVVSIMPIAVRAKARVSRDLFSILVIAIVLADLFASGINYNPTCECSKVYPDTPLTKKLQSIAKNSRIAPINQSWSMFQTPDAILPPNSAMVYGLYDVQGYDSLYTRAYKNLSSEVQGEDSSPIENGNMVFMKKITPEISKLARYVVSKQKLDLKYLKPAGHTTGAYVYRLINSQIINQKSQMNFYSFRLGLFLMLVGVGALSMVGVYRVMKYNHRT